MSSFYGFFLFIRKFTEIAFINVHIIMELVMRLCEKY